MPRAGRTKSPHKNQRHDPFHLELAKDEQLAKYGKISVGHEKRIKRKRSRTQLKRSHSDESEESEAEGEASNSRLWRLQFIIDALPTCYQMQKLFDAKTSKRILTLAQRQQEEEMEGSSDEDHPSKPQSLAMPDDDDENTAGPRSALSFAVNLV